MPLFTDLYGHLITSLMRRTYICRSTRQPSTTKDLFNISRFYILFTDVLCPLVNENDNQFLQRTQREQQHVRLISFAFNLFNPQVFALGQNVQSSPFIQSQQPPYSSHNKCNSPRKFSKLDAPPSSVLLHLLQIL